MRRRENSVYRGSVVNIKKYRGFSSKRPTLTPPPQSRNPSPFSPSPLLSHHSSLGADPGRSCGRRAVAAAATGDGRGGSRRWMRGGWNQRRLPSSQIRCRRLRRMEAAWRVDTAAAPPGGQWRRPSPPDLAPSDPNPILPNARPPPHPHGAQDSPRHLPPSPTRHRRRPPSTRRRRSHPSSPALCCPSSCLHRSTSIPHAVGKGESVGARTAAQRSAPLSSGATVARGSIGLCPLELLGSSGKDGGMRIHRPPSSGALAAHGSSGLRPQEWHGGSGRAGSMLIFLPPSSRAAAAGLDERERGRLA